MSDYGNKITCPCEACKKARAAEQGQACANCGHHNPHTSPAGDVADACNEADCNCGYYTPAQPPAGDVVVRMCDAYWGGRNWPAHVFTTHAPNRIKRMAAALAVAREGMVSRDSMKDLLEERDAQWEKALSDAFDKRKIPWTFNEFMEDTRTRLAKSAEQTDEEKVEAILVSALKKLSTLGNGEHPGNSLGNEIAQKALTDAIRLREELKAGKQ